MNNENVKVMKYNGVGVVFVKVGNTWMVSARNLGNAVGYYGKGKRLTSTVKNWLGKGFLTPISNMDQPHNGDCATIIGTYLTSFMDAAGKVASEAAVTSDPGATPSLTVLSLQGVSKVVAKANVKGMKVLRNCWEEVTTALMTNEKMPVFNSPVEPKKGQMEFLTESGADKDDLKKLRETALFSKELADQGIIPMGLVQQFVGQAIQGYIAKNWPGAIVPRAEVPVAIAPLSDDVLSKSGGLSLMRPLPEKFKGWMTAYDMGQRLGKHESSIGHYIPIVIEEEYGPEVEMRANKKAEMEKVSHHLETFRDHVDPETGLALVWNDDKSCVAIFHQNGKGGGFNWRNYWSPGMSKWLMTKLATKYGMVTMQIPLPAPMPVMPPPTNGS